MPSHASSLVSYLLKKQDSTKEKQKHFLYHYDFSSLFTVFLILWSLILPKTMWVFILGTFLVHFVPKKTSQINNLAHELRTVAQQFSYFLKLH